VGRKLKRGVGNNCRVNYGGKAEVTTTKFKAAQNRIFPAGGSVTGEMGWEKMGKVSRSIWGGRIGL